MDVYTKDEALKKRRQIIGRIKKGEVFIYPTDTIYGIGCDATNEQAVKRIRELKIRNTNPFSVIAPSIEWIQENCEVPLKKWLIKLPGPYTLVLPIKNLKAVPIATNMGLKTLGVRIPRHWFFNIVEATNLPIVTTSVNKAGLKPCASLEEFKKFDVDFIIDEGMKNGVPSTVVDLSKGERILR